MTAHFTHQRLEQLLSFHATSDKKTIPQKKEINLIIGCQLRTLRINQGLTGAQLSKILGISQQQVSRYETGITALSFDMVVMLCVYFNVSLERFLSPLIFFIEKNNGNDEDRRL